MIKVDFALAISGFFCLILLFVFIVWIFYNYQGGPDEGNTKALKQCPYCSHLFFNDGQKEVEKCPRCQSYLSSEDSKLKEFDVKGS